MKKNIKRLLSLILCITLMFSLTQAIFAESEVTSSIERINQLLENISQTYTEKSTYWEVMDMGAYALYCPETENKLTGSAKQELINNAITEVSTTESDTALAKIILSLSAIGRDSTQLYKVNNNDALSAVDKLNQVTQSTSVWNAPYTLAAYNRDEFSNREKELVLVNALLDSQLDDGSWDEWGTIDTTANAICGLAFYMDDADPELSERVNTSIENAVNYLSTQQNPDGSFSDMFSGKNSNSTAMVVIGLAAAGVDLENDARFIKEENSIIDGLLSFVLEGNTGFGYTDNLTLSDYSTEQCFRALISAAQVITTGEPYNVYDFSTVELTPAREMSYSSGTSGDTSPLPTPDSNKITVKVTIKTETEYWLKNNKVTLDPSSTAADAFILACTNNGIIQEGAQEGYISSVTNNGKTLAEFTNGPNSGWLYKVNGVSPVIGIDDYEIENGDTIIFYYTNDYNLDPSSSNFNKGKKLPENDTTKYKTENQISDDISSTAKVLIETVTNPTVAQTGGEWTIIALARSSEDVPTEYFAGYYKNVLKHLKEKGGILHEKKFTEYSRLILSLTALGFNPEDIDGYNLLLPLADFEKTVWQGINGPVWALIALDSNNYEIPANPDATIQATREMYIDEILNHQLKDGGWSLSGDGNAEADITAMALTALSKYTNDKTVKKAIDKGVSLLSSIQNKDGGFENNSESTSQVIVALCCLGIDINDSRFNKNGKTPLDSLLSYNVKDDGFKHTKDEKESNILATEQCLYSLVALDRFNNKKNSLYNMTDAIPKEDLLISNSIINKMPVVNAGKTFDDISNHINKTQIEALAERNIINGKTDSVFDPDTTMTRAEFSTIVVRALGLELTANDIFDDVKSEDWHFSYIATAFNAGIVNGVSETSFNPDGVITKEEASVMVARAGMLCGFHIEDNEDYIRNVLSAFTDYTSSSDWAKSSLAFCFDNGILDKNEIAIEPQRYITRAEVSVMLYNLLDFANLL